MLTDGCSIRLRPTPGSGATMPMPCFASSSGAPTPLRISTAGLWIAPQVRIISRPCTISRVKPRAISAPVARGPVEQDAPHIGLGADRQVRPPPHLRREIRHRARHAPVALVDRGRDRHDAVLPRAVLVRHERQPALLQHLGDRADEAGPVRHRIAADRDRAVLAVIRAVEIQIAFELAEVGQHRVPVPAGCAELLPAVVVGRRAAIGDQSVDARPAAQNARLLVARAVAALPDRSGSRRRAAR